MKMNKSLTKWLPLVLLIAALFLCLTMPATAAPQSQPTPFPTPTPGPDGRIMYIVKENDTLWRISAITGITLDELRALNNLSVNDVITPGQELLLGLGGPAAYVPTVGPKPTSTSALPTPTPGSGTGILCVLLFEDVNGDAIRQEDEPSLPGGAISVNDRFGDVSLTADTPSGGVTSNLFPDPEELGFTCFEDIEQGDYNVTVAIPDGYNATTILNYAIILNAGDETYLDFGAQPNTETIAEAPFIPEGGEGKSPLLGIVGGVLLLLGIGLGIYAAVIKK